MNNSVRSFYSGQTILISGSQGYIGSALAERLSGVQCRLRLLHHRPAHWQPSGVAATVELVPGDVTDRYLWPEILDGVDTVFHLANREYHYRSHDSDPDANWRVNALSMLHLLEACAEGGQRPHIIFASSANLYGRARRLPVDESAPDEPLTTWSIHKLTAEQYLRLYAHTHAIPASVLRLANVYGPTANPEAQMRVVINKVIWRAFSGDGLTLYSNADRLRDFVYIDDVTDALLAIGAQQDQLDGWPLIVGSEQARTIRQVWQQIASSVEAVCGVSVPIRVDPTVPIEALEQRDFIGDCSRMRSVSGWRPRTLLPIGIERTVKALLANQPLLQA